MSIILNAALKLKQEVLDDLKFLDEVIEENKDAVMDAANMRELYTRRYYTLPDNIKSIYGTSDDYVAKKVPNEDDTEILSIYGMLSSVARGIVRKYKLALSHDARIIHTNLTNYLKDLDGEISQLEVSNGR